MTLSDMAVPRFTITPSVAVITLVLGLLAQTCGIVWWGARIDQRVSTVEQKVSASSDQAALLARLDERTASLTTIVNRIDARQDSQAAALTRR